MKITDGFSVFLNRPTGYRLFRWMVGGEFAWRTCLTDYVNPLPREKILDIGCGPADILNYLPRVNYTGLDINKGYIRSAKQRFGSRGRFLCCDVGKTLLEEEQGSFDLVLAMGLVHHLNDAQAGRLFELARQALRPAGRLITFDGCYVPGQSRFVRWLLGRDRGKFIRSREEYVKLASAEFTNVESHIRHDLLRVPYTHLIMHCCDSISVTEQRSHSVPGL